MERESPSPIQSDFSEEKEWDKRVKKTPLCPSPFPVLAYTKDEKLLLLLEKILLIEGIAPDNKGLYTLTNGKR